jgi:hypothetical protein
VLANFGDPGQIARGFAWVYRHERRRLRVFAYTLSTVLLASSLLAAILATQAGLAFGFGTPIMKVLVSRHTVIEALDILASVAVYLGLTLLESLFERRRSQKAAVLLASILIILIVSCATAGLHTTFLVFGLVNGLFFRAVQLLAAPKVARVGIVVVCFPLAGLVLASAAVAGFTGCPRDNLHQLAGHGSLLSTHDRSRGACRCGPSERPSADSSRLLKGEST